MSRASPPDRNSPTVIDGRMRAGMPSPTMGTHRKVEPKMKMSIIPVQIVSHPVVDREEDRFVHDLASGSPRKRERLVTLLRLTGSPGMISSRAGPGHEEDRDHPEDAAQEIGHALLGPGNAPRPSGVAALMRWAPAMPRGLRARLAMRVRVRASGGTAGPRIGAPARGSGGGPVCSSPRRSAPATGRRRAGSR